MPDAGCIESVRYKPMPIIINKSFHISVITKSGIDRWVLVRTGMNIASAYGRFSSNPGIICHGRCGGERVGGPGTVQQAQPR